MTRETGRTFDRKQSLQTLMVLALACIVFWYFFRTDWLIYFSAGLLSVGFLWGWAADRISWLWLKFGEGLGWFNSRLILGLVFFLILTPLAFFYRLAGKNKMQLKRKKEGSYFTERNHLYRPEDLRKSW